MHKSQHAFPTSSFILRALIVSSDRGILAIFRFAGCGLMSSFSIFFMLFHLCCTSLLVRKSVGERRKSCGEKKKRTTKLWIKRRKRGDESARTVGATILTLAAARAEKKKNQRGWKSGPSAPGDRSSELRRSLQRSASVIYIYIYIRRVYTTYWTYFAHRTSPDADVFHAARQASCARLCVWLHGSYIGGALSVRQSTLFPELARFAANQLSIFRHMRVWVDWRKCK